MMEIEVLITALIGVVTNFISGGTAWIFARKKYNSEVDNNIITGMKESLDFYTRLSEDNKTRLNTVLLRNGDLETEIKEIKLQMMKLMTSLCVDFACQLRKGDYSLLNKNIPNEKIT